MEYETQSNLVQNTGEEYQSSWNILGGRFHLRWTREGWNCINKGGKRLDPANFEKERRQMDIFLCLKHLSYSSLDVLQQTSFSILVKYPTLKKKKMYKDNSIPTAIIQDI